MPEANNAEFLQQAMQNPVIRDLYGFELGDIGYGEVTLSAGIRDELGHAPGFFQGSVITAIAEFAGAFAAITTAPEGGAGTMSTVDQTIKFVSPARGERMIARGRVIKPARSLIACSVDIYVMRDGTEHLCATMLQSNYRPPERA